MRAMSKRVLECAGSSALWLWDRCGMGGSARSLAIDATIKGKAAMNRRTPWAVIALEVLWLPTLAGCGQKTHQTDSRALALERQLEVRTVELEAANVEVESLQRQLVESREAAASVGELAKEVAERLERVDSQYAELVRGEDEAKAILSRISEAEAEFVEEVKEVAETREDLILLLQHAVPKFTSPEDLLAALQRLAMENAELNHRVLELEGGGE